MRLPTLFAAMTAFVLWHTSAAQTPAHKTPANCDPQGNVRFICGQDQPEDLLLIPGNEWVVTAWHGGNGGVHLINVHSKTVTPLYPSATAKDRQDKQRYGACPGPLEGEDKVKYLTGGLSLLATKDGPLRLFVVHRGKRESVEFFEIDTRGSTPTATWIGCTVVPDVNFNLNSVVGLPDGGFIATVFSHRDKGGPDAFTKIKNGENSGEAWEWHPGGDWTQVPGSESSGTNGLEMSRDGKWLFISEWGGQALIRLSRGASTPKRDRVPLGFRADNARWAPDGALFIAGHTEGVHARTKVVKVDPDTLKVTPVIDHPDTPTYRAGTSALQIGNEIWVGTWQANSVAIFPVAQTAAAQTSTECAPEGDVEFVCGQSAPEDLVPVPGTDWVVASSISGDGGIRLISKRDRTVDPTLSGARRARKLRSENLRHVPGSVGTSRQGQVQHARTGVGNQKGQQPYAVCRSSWPAGVRRSFQSRLAPQDSVPDLGWMRHCPGTHQP